MPNLGPELVKDVDDADGITTLLAELAEETPTEFVQVAVKVYEVPLVSPATVTVPAVVDVPTAPPGEAVTVYNVTEAPPSLVGGDTVTLAEPNTGVAKPITGASGTTALAV